MERFRFSVLAVIFGSGVCVLGKLIIAPTTENSTVAPLVFPTAVPLPEWQPVESFTLAAPINKSPIISGRHYRYIQNNLPLDIEMRYVVNNIGLQRYMVNNRGIQGAGLNVKLLIQLYSSTPPSSGQLARVLRHRAREGVGFYNLFTSQGRAYLSTCINPRGGSTITEAQFQQNRYLYDLQLGRFLSWLLGRGTVRDTRCLWAHLSIPITNSGSEDAYQTLEKAWEDWCQWWRPHFSQS